MGWFKRIYWGWNGVIGPSAILHPLCRLTGLRITRVIWTERAAFFQGLPVDTVSFDVMGLYAGKQGRKRWKTAWVWNWVMLYKTSNWKPSAVQLLTWQLESYSGHAQTRMLHPTFFAMDMPHTMNLHLSSVTVRTLHLYRQIFFTPLKTCYCFFKFFPHLLISAARRAEAELIFLQIFPKWCRCGKITNFIFFSYRRGRKNQPTLSWSVAKLLTCLKNTSRFYS